MRPKIYLYFGEMGAGKSHYALQRAEENAGAFLFLEGDNFCPADMREAAAKFRPVTEDMLERLLHNLVEEVGSASDYVKRGLKGVILCQALYFDEHRRRLIKHWESIGFEVIPIWVKVGWRQNITQLMTRHKAFKWVAYWLFNKPFFQKPTHKFEWPWTIR